MFPKVEGETVVNAPLKSRLTFFAYICWAICAALAMRLAFRAGQGVGLNTSAGEIEMGNATTTIIVGLIETIPMMLFIFALFLLGAYFHGMTKKGVLTQSFATASGSRRRHPHGRSCLDHGGHAQRDRECGSGRSTVQLEPDRFQSWDVGGFFRAIRAFRGDERGGEANTRAEGSVFSVQNALGGGAPHGDAGCDEIAARWGVPIDHFARAINSLEQLSASGSRLACAMRPRQRWKWLHQWAPVQ